MAQVEQAPGEWSPWFNLTPEDGYPTTPWESSEGFAGTNLDGYGLSVDQISSDVQTQVLNSANHERHTFDLLDQEQQLAGETVRFGLEATADKAYWSVSNVRVLADARPSVDLGLEEAHLEGYNASETGLPPGTHASLNATLANHGDVDVEQARVSWELVGVGKTEAPLASGATPISGLAVGEETWTTIPVTIPESLDDDVVFPDDPFGYLRVQVDRVEPTDEDPSNNDHQIGSYLEPVPLQETRSFELGVDVTPEEGSPQSTRTVRLVLENTGNVPLEGVTVERTILEFTATGPQPVPGETVTVETEHPVPPGAQRPVAVLAPDLGQEDRRFTPGDTGSFEVIATASLGGDEKTAQTTVTAEDTLLQANAQQPATGLATDGTVRPEDGWRVDSPGVFGAPNAWHLDLEGAGDDGEPRTHVLDLPEVDLSTAEDPRLSLFQKYEFEDGFDGARLEASLDGGDTWQPVPTADDQPPSGYSEVLGGNPLAGDQVRTPAFTGSTQGEGFDGWVQTTFDLARIPELVEPGERELPMEFLEGESRVEVEAPPNERGLERAYTHSSWQGGSEDPEDAFLVENLSRPLPEDDTGGDGFLYSGDASELRGVVAGDQQFCTEISTPEVELEEGEEAAAEWEEWDNPSSAWDSSRQIIPPSGTPVPLEFRDSLYTNMRSLYHYYHQPGPTDAELSDLREETLSEIDYGPFPLSAVDDLRAYKYTPHPSSDHTTLKLGREVVLGEGDAWKNREIGGCSAHGQPTDGEIVDRVLPPEDPRGANTWRILEIQNPEHGSFNAFSTAPRIPTPVDWNDVPTPPDQDEVPDRVFDSPSYFNARLVTPAVDLSQTDEDVAFSFDHVPAFQALQKHSQAGGVVQVSVKDPLTNEWGPWEQIYQKPDQVNNFTRVEPGSDNSYAYDFTGGYEAIGRPNGPFKEHPEDPFPRADPPFETSNQALYPLPGGEYYFNHCYSVDVEQDNPSGWDDGCWTQGGNVPWRSATFPLEEFAGETIRLAFHAHKMPSCNLDHIGHAYGNPGWQDDNPPSWEFFNCPYEGQRWLVANLTTHQPVFTGQPVDLRLVAGTDGSVDEAHWAVDEIQVTADRYANNIGLHIDEQPDPVGPGQTITLTGEIRNHGTQTRTDLAIQANPENVQGDLTLEVQGEAPARGESDVATPTFTLNPGEARAFTVTLDRSPFGTDNGTGQLILDAVQWNEAVNRFTLVPNDEVPSNLQHEASVDLLGPDPLLGDVELSPSRVAPGGQATITVNATNPTTEPARVRLDCSVQRVQAHDPVNRRQQEEPVPLYAPEPVPCTRAGDAEATVQAVTLDPGTTQLTLQTTPPQGGAYDVRLELSPHDEPDRVLGAHETRLFSGDEPLVHFADFETPNGTAGQADGWRVFGQHSLGFSEQRAARGNFSARLGIPDAAYDGDNNYATRAVTHLATPPIDLRNVTEGDAALTAYHMARFAYGDGGLVQARVLADEANNQWTHTPQDIEWEPLEPVDGYDGHVTSYHVNVGDPTDPNQPPPPSDCRGTGGGVGDPTNPAGVLRGGPGAGDPSGNNPHPDYNPALVIPEVANDQGSDWEHSKGFYTENGYFGSPNDEDGFVPRWEDDWTRSTFPLTDPETGEPVTVTDQQGSSGEEFELLGHVVQFAFTLYTGRADDSDPTAREVQMGCTDPDPLERGRGQGWFVDSVAVAATNLTAQPTSMRTPMTDNATKTLPIRLDNAGPTAEHVTPAIDHDRSSTTKQQAWTEEQRTVPAHGDAITNVTTRFERSPFSLPFEHVVRVEPEEKLNPNSLAETELTLDFDPRTWPDLSVTMLEPDRSPIEGTPVLVPVEIENHGQDRSPSTTLAFTAHHDNGTVNETVSIPSLPPATEDPARATTTAFVSWTPPRGTAGTHELTVEADPEGLVPQYTTSDDADQQRVTVHPLRLANLDIQAENLTVTAQQTQPHLDEQGPVRTYTVPAGTLTTVNVPVTNRGNAPAQDIDVRLALGPTVLPAERIPHLDPGQTREVSFSFRAQEGTHELTLEASSATRDADPSTNRAPRDATIRLQAVDFHVDVDAPETLTLEPGQPTPATIEVTNQGTLGTLVDVTATAPEHATLELDRTQVFLQPSDNVTLDATATLAPDAPGGDHPVHVTVADADDPASATTQELTLHHPPTHDTAVALETTQLPPGPGTLTATLANEGNLAETLTVNATLAGHDVTTQPPTVTVPRGQDAIAKIPVRVPATLEPGTHEVALTLEGTHQDTHEASVDVEATPRAALEPDPEQPPRFDTDGLTLPVRIHNQGNQPLDGSLAVDPTLDARTTPRNVALDAGEATTATVHLAEWTGDESLPLTLRGDEADATLDVPLPRERPDLRILEQRLDKAPPDSDGTSQLEITVGNPSSAHAHDVPVGVYLDGQLADRRTIDTVEPDASHTLTIEWPPFEDSRTITVNVGHAFGLPDEDPSDNAVSLAVGDEEPAVFARIVEDLRGIPAPSVPMLLVAAAILSRFLVKPSERES